MICPDCEFETDKLTTQGRCKQCTTRYNQTKYLNKRDGTNKPYVTLKELKITNPIAYNRVVGRRKIGKSEKTKVTKELKITNDDNKSKYYAKVSKDLEEEFAKNKIDKGYLDIDLTSWIETFWCLLQENSIVLDAVKANKVFDDLSYLYLHNQLNISWDNKEQILDNSLYQKAVLELRRPTKDFIIYWKIISEVIETIRGNETLMELIRNARNETKNKVTFFSDNPTYHTEVDSSMSQADNVKVVDKNYKYYNIKVTVKGLYGHNYTETFKLDTPMYAKSEEHAKERFIEFMNDKFPGVKYKADHIKVEEIKK